MRRSSLKKETIVEDFSEKIPNSVYMHTLEKEGTIFFSRPVKLGSFYLRKHDFAKYKEKNPKKTYVEFKVRGFLNLELVFELEYSNKNINFNAWVLYYLI